MFVKYISSILIILLQWLSYLSLRPYCQCWPHGDHSEEMAALQWRPRLAQSQPSAQWWRRSWTTSRDFAVDWCQESGSQKTENEFLHSTGATIRVFGDGFSIIIDMFSWLYRVLCNDEMMYFHIVITIHSVWLADRNILSPLWLSVNIEPHWHCRFSKYLVVLSTPMMTRSHHSIVTGKLGNCIFAPGCDWR